jgi:hypothetical protein
MGVVLVTEDGCSDRYDVVEDKDEVLMTIAHAVNDAVRYPGGSALVAAVDALTAKYIILRRQP